MSLESGRKFGFYASLMNVILPIVGIAVAIAFVASLISNLTSRIANGTPTTAFSGVFGGGLIIFLIAIGITGVVAYFLFMYAMYTLSKYYKEPRIFKNILYAFIISLVSAVVIFILRIRSYNFNICGNFSDKHAISRHFRFYASYPCIFAGNCGGSCFRNS